MNFSTSPVLVLTLPVWRSRFLVLIFLAGFAVLAGRAVYLQGLRNEFLQAEGESRYGRVLPINANRGRITDRRGEALAISTPVKSIWVIPEETQLRPEQLSRLAALLELAPQEIRRRIDGASRDFVYIKRQIPPELADRVAEMRIPGLFQVREYRRYYPGGEVMAHVLGFTGAEDVGQEGVELAFQGHLAGKSGSRRVIRDRLGQIVEDVEGIRAAQEGKDLQLALDARIQNLAFSQLKSAIAEHHAKAGGIVVIDAATGELLALANHPTYNPNNRTRLTGAQLRNRAFTDTFEPGSTLKPFTVAAALEAGRMTPRTPIQTSPGSLTIGKATIRDAHASGVLTVEQVIQKSSNVGAARIALSLPAESMWNMFRAVGFGAVPGLGFPGEASGRVRPHQSWRPIEQATMSYGHGISVSLVQLARAYSVFAREGELVPLSLTRIDAPPVSQRVLSADTARAVRHMLELAVQSGGTAPRAQIMGYRVAGKTGTAHKQENGGYAARKYVSSFVGFAPASNPRLVVAVMIDEPSNGQYYGGAVAAPVFARVMEGALRIAGVAPDAPMKPIELPPESEVAKESI
ncbi:MAG: penicillin-binding protein 2 [Betaproteobacteria bacterium]|nr:penicillin-binding protein 2 [Betaproteobacteria bacterium]